MKILKNIHFIYKKFKFYIVLTMSLIGLIIIIPIIINGMMFVGNWNVAGESSDWIGFYGSYTGSILGGIITLFGVMLTIDFQEKRRKLDSYPKKIRILHGIVGKLKKMNDHICFEKDHLDEEYLKNAINELLDDASEIDRLVYSNILPIETQVIYSLLPNYKKNLSPDSYGQIAFNENSNSLKIRIQTMNIIDDTIKFLIKYNGKFVNKYNELSM